jgi:hypothetical protein
VFLLRTTFFPDFYCAHINSRRIIKLNLTHKAVKSALAKRFIDVEKVRTYQSLMLFIVLFCTVVSIKKKKKKILLNVLHEIGVTGVALPCHAIDSLKLNNIINELKYERALRTHFIIII